ncbi:delta-60 repeat domain-containing protein [Haliscomenobacter sp.]|uniref:delta-60 repeat domain-containing protein n=1 Tax=Haliscomenobacter sp. TaxID=2717303 RepID=UPI003593E229
MKKLKLTLTLLSIASLLCAQTLDPNFSPKVLRASGGTTMVTQADNKLLIATQSQGFINDQAVSFLFRLEENGELDPSFQYPTLLNNAPTTIKIQQDGKILIGGYFKDSTGQFIGSLLRLLPNGTIDPSFLILKNENFSLQLLEVLPNQKIFILENAITYISQVRLLSRDGSPLPPFQGSYF